MSSEVMQENKKEKQKLGEAIVIFYDYFNIPLYLEKIIEGPTRYVFRFTIDDFRIAPEKIDKLLSNLGLFLGKSPEDLNVSWQGGYLQLGINKKIAQIPTFEELHKRMLKAQGELLQNPLFIPIGISEIGELLCLDLGSPISCHISMVGQTRAGKTVALLGILASMVMRSSPDELQLALIDVKNRLSIFDDIPHLLKKSARTYQEAEALLEFCVWEMMGRYKEREKLAEQKPLVICIDELAGLLKRAPHLADPLEELVSMGAEANIHIIVASQRLTSSNLAGRTNISNNFPCKIGFKVDTVRESSMYVGKSIYLNKLRGLGDCYIKAGSKIIRMQFMYTDEKYIKNKILTPWKNISSNAEETDKEISLNSYIKT